MENTQKLENARITAEAVARFAEYSNEVNYEWNICGNILPGILNGLTTAALKKLVPIDIRKSAGIFFTSNDLADKVAGNISQILQSGIKILDPACGAGNLLIACAKYIPIGQNLDETLKIWSNLLQGYDLYPEFVKAAQLRFLLLAASFHPREAKKLCNIDPKDVFDGIVVGDVFDHGSIENNSCIVVNPPFGHMSSPSYCQWAKGKIQTAAWFIERLVQSGHKGQHIVAILPDVLRSGTRYQKWREYISSLCETVCVEPAGRFDESTDVDVFILHAVLGEKDCSGSVWPSYPLSQNNETREVVANFFDVHVGTVVPHRDPLEGPNYPYIHARTAPSNKVIRSIDERRKHLGRVFSPPFVVLHRTSSPSDKKRIISALIDLQQHVAVENHLIVLLPKDKSYKSCRLLLNVLKSKQSAEWFNKRIRCRHLTVVSVKELPWFEETEKTKIC